MADKSGKSSTATLPNPVQLPPKGTSASATPNVEDAKKLADSAKAEALAAVEAGKSLLNEAKADLPPAPTKLPEATRMSKYIDAAAAATEGGKYAKLGACVSASKPVLLAVIRVYLLVSPYCGWAFRWGYRVYKLIPLNTLQARGSRAG